MSNSYVLLEKVVVGSAGASSVTFSNIPQTGYTDLKVVISGRDSSSAGQSWDGYSFTIRPNGLTTNITQRSLFANGSSAASYSDTSMFNVISMNADTANTFSNVEIYIPNYASSNAKSFSIDGVTENNATNSAIRLSAGLWNQTAAITSLQLNAYSTWLANSTFYLYGVAKLGTTPTIAPKATGGDVIMTDGTYWYHAFRSSGTFTPAIALSCDYLVVAGGGAGGGQNSGGGGAGGLRSATSQAIAIGSYTVTVGAGGAQVTSGLGLNGTNSSFNGLISAGGGGGAGGNLNQGYDASAGGSGGGTGGGGNNASPAGTVRAISSPVTTPAQGSSGGLWSGMISGNGFSGGGGGGASGQGGDGTAVNGSYGGVGGIGSSAFSSWGLITGTGQNVSGTVFYAGGGGGYSGFNGTAPAGGVGGSGGGGQGWASSQGNGAGFAGTTNTGGGGGGGQPTGGTGGSGIVIVRYLVA